MPTGKYHELPVTKIRPGPSGRDLPGPMGRDLEGAERRLGHTDNLMIVVVDFYDGPKEQPDPPHSHPHEQASYVAEGNVLVIIGDQETRLGPGDIFLVPSGVPHTIRLLTEHARLVDCFTPIRQDFLK